MSKALIEELFGHAIQSLADTGAEASALGSFALKLQSKIAPLLEGASQQDLSLEDLIRTTVNRTLEISRTSSEASLNAPYISAPRRGGRMQFERVSVTVNGKRSTVTIDKDLLASVAASTGGPRKATKVVRQIAATLGQTQDWENPQVNRSALINQQLHKQLLENFDLSQQLVQ